MYLLKNFALKDWATFNELFGMPLRLGKFDPAATPADRETLRAAIRSLGTDAAGIISKNTEIEFVEASGRLSGMVNPYQVMAEFCNREMSKAVLGQTLTTDTAGATGTYAAAKTHEGVRRDLLEADAESLAETIREQLLRPLVGFNFGWERPLPWFVFNIEEEEDLKSVAETYQILQKMGQPISVEHIAERFGIPLPEEGQRLVGQAQAADGGREPEEPGGDEDEALKARGGQALALKTNDGLQILPQDVAVLRTQEELSRLVAHYHQAASRAAAEMLAPVKSLIEAGASLEALREGLLTAYGEMDGRDLAELLYQAQILAELRGRFT